MGIRIRKVTPEDAEAILEIYAWYVRETAITFEYRVPSLEEFRRRIEATLEKYPYLAAEEDGRILAYAYAGPFKGRAAYDWSVETTIYADKDARRKGIGRRLLAALESSLARQGILNAYACIGVPRDTEDEYLTFDSVRFHEKMGYCLAGTFHSCGCKFGRWYSMVWMEKMLGDHTSHQAPVIPFPELDPEGGE
ncbi:MAG: GNAT family N-acetyltransferase [Lachnospiraceae bacterium]|nr:GNAT family N-acetyltransferase [Lachnospiraceae bacterium]